MSTQAKILANRLNAQKSTGPNTPHGKAVVSQNALKHGLSARHDVITTESQADFDLHRDALLAELAPPRPHGIHPGRPHRKPLMASKTSRPHPKPDIRRNARKKHEQLTGQHRQVLRPKRFRPPARRNIRLAPRPDPRPHRTKRLLERKSPRPPPDVRTPNRAQPIQNNPRTPKTPPPPRPATFRTKSRTRRPLFSPRPCAGRHHRTKQHPRAGKNRVSRIQNPASSIKCRVSSIEYRVSRIQHHCAKQTQFPNPQNQHKPCNRKELQTKTTPAPPKKTNPIKPNPGAPGAPPAIRDTQYEIRNTKYKPDSPMDTLTKSSYNAP